MSEIYDYIGLVFFYCRCYSVAGIACYNNAKSEVYGLYRYYDASAVNDSSIMIAIGVILLILGIILLIIGYMNRSHKKRNEVILLNTYLCLKCGNIVDASKAFCPKCGNDLNAQKEGK